MASEQPVAPNNNNVPSEFAIVFVVESSLAVAKDWSLLLVNYIFPMLKRLLEAYATVKPRIAFITYATADTVPSPLICKRFFFDSHAVTQEMRESPTTLGIGATNSGGSRGMAALEGLVAAIEVFDILLNVSRNRQISNHIFHIASSSPDSSVHPRWNVSPNFDSITWEAMPAEMKKVAPASPKDLFFQTRPSHCVLLARFPPPQKPNTKRPTDVQSTPDPKRARLAPPVDVSPKVQTPNTPSNQPKPSPLLPPQPKIRVPTPQPPPPPQPQPQPQPTIQPPPPPQALAPAPAPTVAPSFPQMPTGTPLQHQNLQNLVAAMKSVDESIRNLHANIQNAQNAGNTALVENLTQELTKKQMMQQKFKAILFNFRMSQQQAAIAAAQAQVKNGQNQEVPVPQSNIPIQPGMDQQALAAMMHKRTASGSGPAPGLGGPGPGLGSASGGPTGVPPRGPMPPQGAANHNMAAQMQQIQKMADQQQRVRMQTNMAGPSDGNAGMQPAGPSPSHQGASVDQHPPNKGPGSVWHGSLSFSGTGANGAKKDTVVWVVATSPNPPESSRTDTWPSTMPLQPAPRPAVSMTDLQAWIAQHRPVLCAFAPQTHGIADPAGNEHNFKALTTLLIQRKAYAVSAWTLPSGDQGNNILFFPVNMSSLGAACFPLTGLPDLPRPQAPAIPNLLGIDLSNPETRARLQAMPPEHREAFVKQFKQQQQQRLQAFMAQNGGNNPGANNALMAMNAMNGVAQQNHQVQPPQQQPPQQQHSDVGFGGNVHIPGNYGGMGMMNTMGLGQPQQAMMAGMPRPVNAGMRNAMAPNLNYEMMQSFMQRNPEGGMGQ